MYRDNLVRGTCGSCPGRLEPDKNTIAVLIDPRRVYSSLDIGNRLRLTEFFQFKYRRQFFSCILYYIVVLQDFLSSILCRYSLHEKLRNNILIK